jgi:hypothetical protein
VVQFAAETGDLKLNFESWQSGHPVPSFEDGHSYGSYHITKNLRLAWKCSCHEVYPVRDRGAVRSPCRMSGIDYAQQSICKKKCGSSLLFTSAYNENQTKQSNPD